MTNQNTTAPPVDEPSTAKAPAKLGRFDMIRDNGLATVAVLLVVGVAGAGWSASFISLHEFAMLHMGLTSRPAWLVPSTFDGAALGLSLLSFRAAIYGRASLGSMLYVYGFTALSSWINWVHIDDQAGGKFVSALLPIAAVIVFGKVLKEAREAYERRHGKVVFKVRAGLLTLRWLVDRAGTRTQIRAQILAVPVEALIGMGVDTLARDAREQLASQKSAAESQGADDLSQTETPQESQGDTDATADRSDATQTPDPDVAPQQTATSHTDTDETADPATSRARISTSTAVALPHQREDDRDQWDAASNVLTAPSQVSGDVPTVSESDEWGEDGVSDLSQSDAEIVKAIVTTGWLEGDSASEVSRRINRHRSTVYRMFKALDKQYGARPRRNDTGEFPAVSAANGFDLSQ